eukprot:15480202-Alexandrium_andersonii.AAC.1
MRAFSVLLPKALGAASDCVESVYTRGLPIMCVSRETSMPWGRTRCRPHSRRPGRQGCFPVLAQEHAAVLQGVASLPISLPWSTHALCYFELVGGCREA